MRQIFLFLAAALLFSASLRATHIVGYELYSEFLSGSTYRVHVLAYYECNSSFTVPLPGPGTPSLIGVSASAGCTAPVPIDTVNTFVSYQEVTPSCWIGNTRCTNSAAPINGVLRQHEYRDYTLCTTCTGCAYTFYISNCCRSSIITSGQTEEGIYLAITIQPSLATGNSSPRFTLPPSFYCLPGTVANAPNLATDPDGDELRYSLIPAMQGDTLLNTYAMGYTAQSPLGHTWLTPLDSATGDMSLIPNPGTSQAVTTCVKVEEFRNGVKIGEAVRDFLQIVIPSGGLGVQDSTPVAAPIQYLAGANIWQNDSVRVVNGDTLRFSMLVDDPWPGEILQYEVVPSPYLPGPLTWTVTQQSPTTQLVTFTYIPNGTWPTWLPVKVRIRDVGCVASHLVTKQVTLFVSDPQGALPIIQPAGCQASATGSIQLIPFGLQPPISYLWNTGDTTASITGIAAGTYSVQITATNGSAQASYTVPQTSLQVGISGSWGGCTLIGGSVYASVAGGVPPLSFQWNNGSTAAAQFWLPKGTYAVTVSDAAGCQVTRSILLKQPAACGTYISGKLFIDQNNNCLLDAGDLAVPNVMLNYHLLNYISTDFHGNYNFWTTYDTLKFQVSPTPNTLSSLIAVDTTCSASMLVVPQDTFISHNIPIIADSVYTDISAGYVTGTTRSGFTETTTIRAHITHTTPCTAVVTDYYDPVLTNVQPFAYTGTYTHNTALKFVRWTVPMQALAWNQLLNMQYGATVPATVLPGTKLRDSVVVSLTGCTDAVASNNHQVTKRTVTAALDPNDKQAIPEGRGPQGYLPPTDSLLTYTIRFQNTGTDTAFTVIIRDTLPPPLDPATLAPIGARHPNYRVDIESGNVAIFTFDNILLPDSGTDLAGSQGFVAFKILARNWQHMGGIHNRAAIYFDFNAPVITNTVTRTRCVPVAAGFNAFVTAAHEVVLVNTTRTVGTTTYQWRSGNGQTVVSAQPPVFQYPDTGTYLLTLVAQNECSSDTFTQLVSVQPSGVDDSFVRSIAIVPHPVAGVAEIRFHNPGNTLTLLTMSDLQGREVRQFQARTATALLDRTGLAPGIYLLHISGPGNAVVKVVVE